jgi:hypothetical protein
MFVSFLLCCTVVTCGIFALEICWPFVLSRFTDCLFPSAWYEISLPVVTYHARYRCSLHTFSQLNFEVSPVLSHDTTA